MAPRNQLEHKAWNFLNPPYDTFSSPTTPHDEPYIVSGLNVRTSRRGAIERAPGSSAYESTPTNLNDARRTFVYRKWNGDTFIIANEVTATQSKVYKLKVGTDSAFQLIHTMTAASNTTAQCNASEAIDQGGSGGAWANINNVFLSDNNDATTLLGVGENRTLDARGFGIMIPRSATNIQVACTVELRITANELTEITSQFLKNATPVGTPGSLTLPLSLPDQYVDVGSTGVTWTADDVMNPLFGIRLIAGNQGTNPVTLEIDHIRIQVTYDVPLKPFDFVVFGDKLFFSNGGDHRFYDGTTVYPWGIIPPNLKPTFTNAGTGITLTSGRRYVYAYRNSTTGHRSSISPPSDSTGAITDDTLTVTVVGTGQTGVDFIDVYASTDGGDGIYFLLGEVANPGANFTATFTDNFADTTFKTQFEFQAPPIGYNDPPLGLRGLRVFSNRIWGFLNDTLYYSGWEEINTGLEEECFPSGPLGNEWKAPQQIMGLEVIGGEEPSLLILCRGTSFKVTGDTRDTFSFLPLFHNLGSDVECTGTAADGERVFFRGNDSRIWVTNGFEKQIVSEAVTDDLLNIAPTDFSMAVHRYGEVNWLVVADAAGDARGVANTGATNGGTFASFDHDTAAPLRPWNNASNAQTSNDVYATATLVNDSSPTESLRVTNFGFSLPSEAVITGILIEVEGKVSVDLQAAFCRAALVYGGVNIGTLETGSPNLLFTEGTSSIGSSTSLFGTMLSAAVVNDPSFGVDIRCVGVTSTFITVSVDHVRMTIYYHSQSSTGTWYVLDLASGKWLPPWSKSATHLHSGEVAAGQQVLLYTSFDGASAGQTIVRQLDIAPRTAAWDDDSTPYPAFAVLGLNELAPKGYVFESVYVAYELDDSGSPTAPAVRIKADEINAQVDWSAQPAGTQVDPTLRAPGTRLIKKQVNFATACERLLVRFDWTAENKNFKLLSVDLGHRPVGPES